MTVASNMITINVHDHMWCFSWTVKTLNYAGQLHHIASCLYYYIMLQGLLHYGRV